jgi:hypothetical protein
MNGPTHGGVLCGCGRIMRVLKNSVTVEELLADGEPYKLWDADLFECIECGTTVITAFGRYPLAEHYQADYAEQRSRLLPVYPARHRTVAEMAEKNP